MSVPVHVLRVSESRILCVHGVVSTSGTIPFKLHFIPEPGGPRAQHNEHGLREQTRRTSVRGPLELVSYTDTAILGGVRFSPPYIHRPAQVRRVLDSLLLLHIPAGLRPLLRSTAHIMTDLPSPVKAQPRLPIEVCERAIEAVYTDWYYSVSMSLATLSSCALVCRAWRPRAQRVLFDYVLFRDKDALYGFAELLDASPELGTYVHTLELRGYLHVPYSPAVLFLTALRGKLTNLAVLYIYGVHDAEKAVNPLPEGEKELPFLPIYQYFPSLLTSISHIRRLDFADVRFPSFGDFARFLNTLSNLKELYCYRISWAVLGLEPVCMAKRSSADSRKMFLPNLEILTVCLQIDQGTGLY